MFTFILYWLLHQYVLFCFQHPGLPVQAYPPDYLKTETRIGTYQCPGDYLRFPDQESLLIHWQVDHPYYFETYQKLDEAYREKWMQSLQQNR